MVARLLILGVLVAFARPSAAQTDDAKLQQRLNNRLQILQRMGNYVGAAEVYIELANLQSPRTSINNLVQAGRNFMYAYRYKRQDPRYLALARQPLQRAIAICDRLKPQDRQNQRYSLRQVYDVLAELELSGGRPAAMLRHLHDFVDTPGLDDSFKSDGRMRVDLARVVLGDQAAVADVATAIKKKSHLRYQVQNITNELIRQATRCSKRPGRAALAKERALRTRAARLVLLWERGYERRHFNLWNYRWAAEALVDGGEPGEAVRLLEEMGSRITKKPLSGSRSNWWQNQRIDEARLHHARALLALGRAREAYVIFRRLYEQAYLIAPGGDVVGRGRWLGRGVRSDGRGVTRLEVEGRVVRYVDLQVYPGGLVSCVRSDLFGKHRRHQVRIVQRPLKRRYEVVAGLAQIGLRTWKTGGASPSYARGVVVPALKRLRTLLRSLKPAQFRAKLGRVTSPSAGTLAERGWRAELDLAWVRLSLGQATRVRGELQPLVLSTPPTPALAAELSRVLSAAGAAAPHPSR